MSISISGYSPFAASGANASGQNSPAALFQQLGQDLKSGNLSGAQSAFAAIQSELLQASLTGSASNASGPAPGSAANGVSGSVTTDFQNLGKDLQSGNLSAAQADYTKLTQDGQAQGALTGAHRHHHHHDSGGIPSSSATNSVATANATSNAATNPLLALINALNTASSAVTPGGSAVKSSVLSVLA
jgi:hypothetical protein